MILISIVRSIIFYSVNSIWTLFWSIFSISTLIFIPTRYKHFYVASIWAYGALFLARWICGIKWHVTGKENIPKKPCVVVCNHQSFLETFFLQTLFSPQSIVLKKELLSIPGLGWGLRVLNTIPIDRSKKTDALKKVNDYGFRYLKKNIWVVIFPEGTRQPWPTIGKITKGAAILAKKTNCPVLPVFQNSGHLSAQPKRLAWVKKTGTVFVEIGSLINTENQDVNSTTNTIKVFMEKKLTHYSKTKHHNATAT